jgi:hypothetical protein
MRPMYLARVSADDVAVNEYQRGGYRQYVRDHPEEALRFGIKEPPLLVEGELVGVALDQNGTPTLYPLREITAADLPTITSAEREALESKQFLLRLGDLGRRWNYTRQGVQKFLARHKDFPPPCFTLNGGQVRIWSLTDCERYERDHSELTSESAKLRKVRSFARARARGPQAGA